MAPKRRDRKRVDDDDEKLGEAMGKMSLRDRKENNADVYLGWNDDCSIVKVGQSIRDLKVQI